MLTLLFIVNFYEDLSLFSMLYKMPAAYLLGGESDFSRLSVIHFLPFLCYAEIQYILFLVFREVTNSFASKVKKFTIGFLALK